MSDSLVPDGWKSLTQWTSARIALGRIGVSSPTRANLDFGLDHARARDSVHDPLDLDLLEQAAHAQGLGTHRVQSLARDRSEYLRRPDLGRALDEASQATLREPPTAPPGRLTVVIADGLASRAPRLHALPLLEHLRGGLEGWTLDDVILATQARVALGDAIGVLRCSEAVLMLIGERPGLKAADSLGAYLTYQPQIGRTDADRNCVSNIRPAGLEYAAAAHRLLYLLRGARALGRSGILLKDNSDLPHLEEGSPRRFDARRPPSVDTP